MKAGSIKLPKSILVVLILTGLTIQLFSQSKPPVQASRHYVRAPDTIPGTLPEMRDSAFWIARMKQPDAVVMNLSAIGKMNSGFRERMISGRGIDTALAITIGEKVETSPGLFSGMPDVYSKTASEVAAITRSEVDKELR